MTIYSRTITALWLVFIAYWAVSAAGAKRSLGAQTLWKEGGLRVIVIVLVVLALRVPIVKHAFRVEWVYTAGNPVMGSIGVGLCALGVGVAILARIYLGRNWGMPASRKEHPELVTTGPYAVVRHPIYTGVLLAMLGSAIAETIVWLLPLVLFGAYFISSARREEQFMMEQFPDRYPPYTRRTKMLLPFVL